MATQNIRNKYSCVNDQMRDALNTLMDGGTLVPVRQPGHAPIKSEHIRARRPKRKTIQFESMAELMEHEDQKKLFKALAEEYKL